MKKLLIISDSHGNRKGVEKLMPLIAENDYVVHFGGRRRGYARRSGGVS